VIESEGDDFIVQLVVFAFIWRFIFFFEVLKNDVSIVFGVFF
jgi:hypothetical protein